MRVTLSTAAAGFSAAANQRLDAPSEQGLVIAEGVEMGGELSEEPVQLLAVDAWIVGSPIHDLRRKGISELAKYINTIPNIFPYAMAREM